MAAPKLEEKRRRSELISALLEREHPEAKCALNYETPEQLLFATS